MSTFRALGFAAALAVAVLPASAKADDCAALTSALEHSSTVVDHAGARLSSEAASDPEMEALYWDAYMLAYNSYMGDWNRWLAGGCLKIIIFYY
jgi:hypothetical protein